MLSAVRVGTPLLVSVNKSVKQLAQDVVYCDDKVHRLLLLLLMHELCFYFFDVGFCKHIWEVFNGTSRLHNMYILQ